MTVFIYTYLMNSFGVFLGSYGLQETPMVALKTFTSFATAIVDISKDEINANIDIFFINFLVLSLFESDNYSR